MAWAEDRALLGSNLSAVPGAKIGDWGDPRSPPLFAISEIGTKAKNPGVWGRAPAVCGLSQWSSFGRELSTQVIPLALFEHVPDDRGKLSHHGNSGDTGTPSTLNPLEPLPQSGVLSQYLIDHLCQQPPGHAAASFRNASQALIVFSTISAARCETPVIGQTAGTRKTFYSTNTAR